MFFVVQRKKWQGFRENLAKHVNVCIDIKKIIFKELANATLEAGKPNFCRVGQQAEGLGRADVADVAVQD